MSAHPDSTNSAPAFRIFARFRRDLPGKAVGSAADRIAIRTGRVQMKLIVDRFWNDELGSSVVDWAVFGAGVVSLGVALVSTLA